MLPSRLASDDRRSVARLSHAIRLLSTRTGEEWPEINSVNLDDMLSQPLPPIDRQMTNLLMWASAQLEDDQLGAVELPEEENLTGVIGTIDGPRVGELIERAKKEGLIDFVPDDCISVTSQGWARLEPPAIDKATIDPIIAPQQSESSEKTTKSHCNKCHGTTNSWIRAAHTISEHDGPISWSNTFEVLQCCGCDTLSVRHEHWFSEWDDFEYDEYGREVIRPGIKTTYYPPPTVRSRPEWSDIIGDEVLRNVLDELYAALNSGLSVLASVGARTLLDRAGYLLIGDPRGGFEGKLSALQSEGFISGQEKKTLEAVADAGNASAHRGYTPTSERLGHIVDII
jgi:hypothetical protein